MNEVLAKYVDIVPVIKDALGMDMMMSITDGYNFLGYWPGEKIVADIHVGDELNHEDPMWQVFNTGKKIEAVMPANVYGFEFKAIMVPIFDDGEIVGTMGIAISLENETFTASTADKLIASITSAQEGVSEIEGVSSAIQTNSEVLAKSTQKLVESLEQIHQFVSNINAISGKTNILALNASIEAARSGAAGAGFAVVATSMRGLAADTKAAADEVLQLLNGLEQDMDDMKAALTDVSDNQNKQNANTTKMIEAIKDIEVLTNSLADRMKADN